MLLICERHNENAQFTRGTQSGIYFPGSGNNSLWACLCSDFNLWALRSCWRTLMFCLNELTVLLDTAPPVNWLPPPILSPVINTTSARWYQILDRMLREATFFFFPSFNFVNDWRKYDCCFPPCPIWAQALWCVRLYVSKQRWAGFCYLTALQHPVGEPLCRMHLQGMVFVRAWAKATTSNPLLSLHFFPSS